MSDNGSPRKNLVDRDDSEEIDTVSNDRDTSENNDMNNVSNNDSSNDLNNTNNDMSRGDAIGINNAVLAYIHYGISSASPENVKEVACTHFTLEEIVYAKDKLWKECSLGEPLPRNNSKGRKKSEAHLQDIINEIYKLDREEYVFFVDSGGIARLPRFNAECLNVVGIDKRIADLNEQCFALKLEASSYRNDFLKCNHELSLIRTVLQQHTDALRHLRNADGTYGNELHLSNNCNISSVSGSA